MDKKRGMGSKKSWFCRKYFGTLFRLHRKAFKINGTVYIHLHFGQHWLQIHLLLLREDTHKKCFFCGRTTKVWVVDSPPPPELRGSWFKTTFYFYNFFIDGKWSKKMNRKCIKKCLSNLKEPMVQLQIFTTSDNLILKIALIIISYKIERKKWKII